MIDPRGVDPHVTGAFTWVFAMLMVGCGATAAPHADHPADEPAVGRMVDSAFLDDRVDQGELQAYRVAASSRLSSALTRGADQLRASAMTWCHAGRAELPVCAQIEQQIAALEALARNASSACERQAAALGTSTKWAQLCGAPARASGARRIMVIGASQ